MKVHRKLQQCNHNMHTFTQANKSHCINTHVHNQQVRDQKLKYFLWHLVWMFLALGCGRVSFQDSFSSKLRLCWLYKEGQDKVGLQVVLHDFHFTVESLDIPLIFESILQSSHFIRPPFPVFKSP